MHTYLRLALVVFLSSCAGGVRTTQPRSPERVAEAPPRRTPNDFATAVSTLVPYDPQGGTIVAIGRLLEIGRDRRDPSSRDAQYLAAAASTDIAAWATFAGKPEVLDALGALRGLPPGRPEDLHATLEAELLAVRNGHYRETVQGLLEGLELVRAGPRSPRGVLLARRMIERGSPGAHIAAFVHAASVRRALAVLGREPDALSLLAVLGEDPCEAGCPGSPIANATVEMRRAVGAVTRAYRTAGASLAAGEQDPFGALVRPTYEEAHAALSRVVLPTSGATPGTSETRVIVRIEPTGVRMTVQPIFAVVDGEIAELGGLPEAEPTPYPVRWPARVTTYEPFVEASRHVLEQSRTFVESITGAEPPPWIGSPDAAPVAVAVGEDLPGHLLARVILSLQQAGFSDVRLRREDASGAWEIRTRPVLATQVDPQQGASSARVEIYAPFDQAQARSTLERHRRAGRPAQARLVLFALIASRALYGVLDAVRETWPHTETDLLLVLPHTVP